MTGSGPSVSSKNVCSVITPDDGGPSDDVGLSDDVGPSDGVTTKRIFEGTLGPEPPFVILLEEEGCSNFMTEHVFSVP